MSAITENTTSFAAHYSEAAAAALTALSLTGEAYREALKTAKVRIAAAISYADDSDEFDLADGLFEAIRAIERRGVRN